MGQVIENFSTHFLLIFLIQNPMDWIWLLSNA